MPVYVLPEMENAEFKDLDLFTQGYIQAMFFTNQSCIPMCEFHTAESQHLIREGQADGDLPNDAGFADLHPDALIDIIADCVAFQIANPELLAQAVDCEGYDMERAGMDFWYTRNGHGVGYWSRDELEQVGLHESFGSPRVGDPRWSEYHDAREDNLARKLTDAVEGWGEVNPWFSEVEEPDSATGFGFVYHDS